MIHYLSILTTETEGDSVFSFCLRPSQRPLLSLFYRNVGALFLLWNESSIDPVHGQVFVYRPREESACRRLPFSGISSGADVATGSVLAPLRLVHRFGLPDSFHRRHDRRSLLGAAALGVC